MILQPNPRLRPSCNTLVNQEIIANWIAKEGIYNEQQTFEDQLNYFNLNPNQLKNLQQEKKQDLLNTIKLTPKLSLLNQRLPKS